MPATTKKDRQVVLFKLDNEIYGMDITLVREIIRMQKVTHVPRAPLFVEGVINLRGKVIPVINIKKKFGLDASEESPDSCIVVVDITGGTIGIIVDAVTEVLQLPESTIEPASDIVVTADSAYLQGIAKVGERMVILLDLEKALSKDDLPGNELSGSESSEEKKAD